MVSPGSKRNQDRQQELHAALEPVVQQAGFDLESLVVTPAGRRSLLRVIVDGDNGVNLDDIAVISRAVSERLDELDHLTGAAAYTLEVTSPGVDRPLTESRHWRRAVTRLIRTQVDDKPIEGRIVGVEGDVVSLDVAGTVHTYDVAQLGPGKVQVEFSRRTGTDSDSSADAPPSNRKKG